MGRVRVRLFWWGGAFRRLVLVRTIDCSTHSVCEMWRSQPVNEDEVAAAGLVLKPAQWHQLWSGLPVERFDLPVPLYRVSYEDDPYEREAMSEALSHPDFHLIFSVHTIVHYDLRESVLLAMDRPEVGTHRLARPFRFSADHSSLTFARLTTEAPPARSSYEVNLSDVRGVMIGDGNEQINRFDITVQDAEFDLERVLARTEVRRAIAEVTMNPGDESRRARLINVLAHPGWFVSWHPARLSVNDPGAKRSTSFLAALLGFNVDVKVGDNQRQTNRFTYVTSCLPKAQDLLANNVKLARAVAELICPAHATTDTESLLKVVNEAVQELPVDFVNGRLQALILEPYPRMSLVHVDGAMVGEDFVQVNLFNVVADIPKTDFERKRPEREWLGEPYLPKSPGRRGEYRGPSGPALF
ncbi:hypothetical protein [Micromonospora sp. NPDC005305]|uniref:hypothetical protein n=1 Tax=Micromonospora sp. NPDC005305 TaxID=3156875 RepID=UPI0033A9C792